MTSQHSWSTPDLTPFSTGVMTCLRCGASTNNAFLAFIYPCVPKEPAVTDEQTPMECHSLDQSRDETVQAQLLARQRRLMRRHYSTTFAKVYPLPQPEPVLEQSGFAPRTEDEAQAEQLKKRDPLKDSYWFGFGHGFVTCLIAVLALTGALLWGYR